MSRFVFFPNGLMQSNSVIGLNPVFYCAIFICYFTACCIARLQTLYCLQRSPLQGTPCPILYLNLEMLMPWELRSLLPRCTYALCLYFISFSCGRVWYSVISVSSTLCVWNLSTLHIELFHMDYLLGAYNFMEVQYGLLNYRFQLRSTRSIWVGLFSLYWGWFG